MSRLRRILHPTDFSPASRAGFTRALSMARKEEAELFLAHVVAPLVTVARGGPVSPHMYDGREIETAARKYGEKQLSVLQAKAQSAGVRATTLVVGASCPVLTVRGR